MNPKKRRQIHKREQLQRVLNDMLLSMRFLLNYFPHSGKASLSRTLSKTPPNKHLMLKKLLADEAQAVTEENIKRIIAP